MRLWFFKETGLGYKTDVVSGTYKGKRATMRFLTRIVVSGELDAYLLSLICWQMDCNGWKVKRNNVEY